MEPRRYSSSEADRRPGLTAALRILLLTAGCALATGFAVLWLTAAPALGQEGETPAPAAEATDTGAAATDATDVSTATIPASQPAGAPDQACRLCHADSTAIKTLPSGETLAARIDLSVLAASVHGSHSGAAVYCTDCHQPKQRYQFPHQESPAQSIHDFEREISSNCESCHVSSELHNPGHIQALNSGTDSASLPACVDCHGGHDVEPPVAYEADPAGYCQSCHAIADMQDEQVRWTHEQLLPSLDSETSCRTCHSDQVQSQSQQCATCHTLLDVSVSRGEDEIYLGVNGHDILTSVHGKRVIDGVSYPALQCTDCHRDMAEAGFPHPDELLVDREQLRTSVESACEDCHKDAAAKSADGIHSQRIAEGELNAASCADCHGSHNIQAPNVPRSRLSSTCGDCHGEVYDVFKQSVHGASLLERDNPDVPVCTDCHGAHNIADPTTAAFRAASPQMCGDCHADKEMMSKYDISVNVFESYVADFHGSTATIFAHENPNEPINTAVCYDCHGVHDIQSISDATEEQIQVRLLESCRQCHPDASENFPSSWMSHYEPSLENYPAVYLVDLFYKVFIPTILGGFMLFIGSDIFRRMTDRWVARRERRRKG